MDRNKIIYSGVFLIIIVILIYSFQGEESAESYKNRILEDRKELESFMRNDEESPFVSKNADFHGLHFYEPDLKYKVNARFEPIENKKIRKLPTSDDTEKEYLEYGYVTFTMDGQDQKLIILESVGDEELFLAFGDATSANGSYGAGRYLEVKHNGGKTIPLDFNKSYNPYCAYTEGYSCPLPPRENLLEVAIKAGEKDHDH